MGATLPFVSGHEFEDTHLSSVNARMASHAGEGPRDPVDDVERAAAAGEPPVPGAQWDEAHRRWERWDEAAQAWVVVGDDAGDGVDPRDENPLSALLARDALRSAEIEAGHEVVADVARGATPGPGPEGAQWNEVADRWERWDEAADAWVEATDDGPAAAT